MKVIIDESVYLFLKENKIKLSLQFKTIISQTIISHLKVNPRMYPMVTDDVNIRHFIIKNIDFCYVIDNEEIIVSDCRFKNSNLKLKIK